MGEYENQTPSEARGISAEFNENAERGARAAANIAISAEIIRLTIGF